MGRHAPAAPSRGAEMGKAKGHERFSHARSRLAAYSYATRSVVKQFAANSCGATAIEYALIARLLSNMILSGVTSVGTKLVTFFTTMSANLK